MRMHIQIYISFTLLVQVSEQCTQLQLTCNIVIFSFPATLFHTTKASCTKKNKKKILHRQLRSVLLQGSSSLLRCFEHARVDPN